MYMYEWLHDVCLFSRKVGAVMSEKSDPSSAGTAPHVSQVGAGSKDIVDNGGGGAEDLCPSPRIVENGEDCMEVP